MWHTANRRLVLLVLSITCMWSLPASGREAVGGPAAPGAKRAWGPEQATGAPDTPLMGDFSTAWASLQPDGGMEWLRVEFARAVVVDEVRIRESYNPGAVCRVVAILADGLERLLWAQDAAAAPAPVERGVTDGQPSSDFVVKCKENVVSKSVIIYLDSARVPGWNEIDAVELVGKDGSQQWAARAEASSTYAQQVQGRWEIDPITELCGKKVEVQLDSGKSVRGVLVRRSANLIVLTMPEDGRTVILNIDKMVTMETVGKE